MNTKNQLGSWSIIAVSVLIGFCIIVGSSQDSATTAANNADTAQPSPTADDTANQYGSGPRVQNNANTYHPVYPRPTPSSGYVAPRPSQPTTYIRPALGVVTIFQAATIPQPMYVPR